MDELKILILLISSGLVLRFSLTLTGQAWAKAHSQTVAFMVLPVITYVITKTISGNIALSLGMIGALSIVRFRTPIRTPYELVHYFSLLTIGISAKVDLGVTFVLIVLLSLLPYFIKKFSPTRSKMIGSSEKLTLNFEATINEKDLKKITNDKNLRNYSVKNENNNFNISGLVVFNNEDAKNKFLDQWSSKIKTYNVDLDEGS